MTQVLTVSLLRGSIGHYGFVWKRALQRQSPLRQRPTGVPLMAAPPGGSYGRRDRSPWNVPKPYGAPGALQSAGTVAAPLLAGFSFTLVGLVLTSPGTLRWPDASLVLLTAAGLFLITAVQGASWARRWDVTPTEILSWWPNFEWLPDALQEQVFSEQHTHSKRQARWARATRLAYNGGILSLLAGMTVLLAPPKHQPIVSLRGLAMLLALLGFLGEITWVVLSEIL
jgi:hypothetical protein